MNTDWHDLIQRYGAGICTEEESAILSAALQSDDALARLYLRHMNLDVALEAHATSAETTRSLLARPPGGAPASGFRTIFWPLVAAALALAACVSLWRSGREPGAVAQILESQGARWQDCSLPTEAGSRLQKGTLRLAEGLARLRFARGAEVILEGPAELELIEPQLCRLLRGSLVAHVPEPARGFVVLTQSAKLIDHGTDFGVMTDQRGHAKVQVMQGEVELRHANGSPPLRLVTRQTAVITPETLLPQLPFEAEPRRSEEPQPTPFPAAEISTRTGKGAAAYVSEPRTENNQSDQLLLLKNCAEEGYGRKVLLRFDLSALPEIPSATPITTARLTLHFGPSGYGYASRGGHARIAVYALVRDEEDFWDPENLRWNEQPAFAPSAGRVNETEAVRVGEFTVPQGVQSGFFSVEDPRLLERIKADPNRLLTLILVRENAIQVDGGLVLGIAGNRHPTLPSPKLSLR